MILSISNVAKSFAQEDVLCGATIRVEKGEKVALVGRNGCGKSTLLKIITGQMEADTGSYLFTRGASVGYLRQEHVVDEDKSLIEEAEESRKHILEIRTRLGELEKAIETGSSIDDLEEYALLHEHFLENEGYSIERDLKIVLNRMGFEETDFSKKVGVLSGGEKTRLALAKMLLEEPDLLILDEPTNHLDLQATEWLESWINGYRGAALIVSHDRIFLQSVSERVIELRDGQAFSYTGPFEKFLRLRKEEEERNVVVAQKQQKEIDKLDEFVRRFINSERVAQARGKRKIMTRLIESKVQLQKDSKGIKGGFKSSQRSSDLVVETKNLSLSFGSLNLFSNFDWTVKRGEKWGVVGDNGSGKSSLIRVILGLLEPTNGISRIGANVVAGYFSQDAADLDPNSTPLETLTEELGMEIGAARNLLGRFLFSGDQVFQTIKSLSGGEKNKLSLAKLTQLNPNLLVLDEPTNHLDLASREALGDILCQYDGTLILVSHDRWLLSFLTTHTLDIRKEGIQKRIGNYSEFRREASSKDTHTRFQEKQNNILKPRELSKAIVKQKSLIQELELLVSKIENKVASVESQLSEPNSVDNLLPLTMQHGDLVAELQKAVLSWEAECTRLDVLVASQQRKQ